jgi:hypothetical protein
MTVHYTDTSLVQVQVPVLTWTLELKPGEERKITYSYQLYVLP